MTVKQQALKAIQRLPEDANIRDITEEQANKQTIEENERLKLLALEAVGLRTFALDFTPDSKTNPHGKIVLNQSPRADWWNDVHPEDQPLLEREFTRFFRGETELLHTLFRTATEQADEVWMESWAVASSRNEQGVPQGIVGVIMDRTQSKQLESKLISGQRLESLGVLAGGIAHDFNNLLLSITGALDVALAKQPELIEDLGVIDEAARQAAQLCDQLLTYAGRGSVELTTVDLAEVLTNMQDLLKMSVHTDALLEFAIETDCPVSGDASQLSQIAMNLVKNASDALAGSPGQIRIELSAHAYDPEWALQYHLGQNLMPGEYFRLQVSDTGQGISEQEMDRLF